MNWTDLIKDIKQKKFAPLYFLQGEEPYYIEEITNAIEENALNESERSFNQTVLYGRDIDMATVLSNAKRFPMMAERQVVIVKEAQHLRDLSLEGGQQLLGNYADNPVPTTVLVFCYMNKTLDGRKALSKKLNNKAILFTGKKLYDNQVPAWINQTVQAKNHRISPKAVALLSEFIGNNLERLSNEIMKLLLNVEAGTEIDEKHVEKFVGVNKDYNVFEFQNALMQKNTKKVYEILNYFIQNQKSNPPVLFIGAMYGFLVKLLLVCTTNDSNPSNIAKLLGVSPYFVKDYISARRFYTYNSVIKGFAHLSEADKRLKGVDSGTMSPGEIMREFTFKLLHS